VGEHAHPDGRQHPELPEPPSERDRVVDRAAAGVQHNSFALDLMIAREIIEMPWGLGGDDADCADPASAIRLASDPAELHRQFASFEGNAGTRRTAQHSYQGDAKSGTNEQHPTSDFRPSKAWIGDAGALCGFGPRDEHDSVTSAWLSGGAGRVATVSIQWRQLAPSGRR